MASSEQTNEVQGQIFTANLYNAEEAGNAHLEDATIMHEIVINESNSSMEDESSSLVAKWQKMIEKVRKVENRGGNAVEVISKRALMKQRKNEVQSSAGRKNNTYKSTIF
ncbi:unnamed protein product [Cercopithifilaria johnstoni]|uniref:Uncharacterized protein n=1 Tax=Cercopithifilaria johnstoni TaxID=2874296 RepID=A0A8J2LY70_9BILA|nr:unnamed protein product [Cercopithifilaria johnstoni]